MTHADAPVAGEGTPLRLAASPVSVTVSACSSRLLRLRIGEGIPVPVSSYVSKDVWPGARIAATLEPSASFSTDELRLMLAHDPERLLFCDRSGNTRLTLALDNLQRPTGMHLSFDVAVEQHFYGLGEGGQPLDRLGVARRLWNCHVNRGPGASISVPLLLSHLGYGLFFDNSHAAVIDPGDSDGATRLCYRSEVEALDLYYIGGADLGDVLAEAAELLGHAPMPPRWALGYMQSSRHFEDAADLLRLPMMLRDKHLPCDALIFLSTYGDGLGWNEGVGHLECQKRLIPKPAELFSHLKARHFHVITHEYPVLHQDSPLHAAAREKGYLLDAGYPNLTASEQPWVNYREGQRFLDFSRAEVRTWWWEAHRHLLDLGVDGWWLDGGEGPPGSTELAGGDSATLHNRYDLMRHQAFAEGEARDRPDQRVFLLCRSGGAGMQRYGAGCWSGDINCNFQTLEEQIALGLNVGLSGIPYWGTDVGGFYPSGGCRAELFARWFQFGAFCPIFRAHGRTWREHLPWSHGEGIEAICRRYLELRYRLMPYTYTLAWQAHRSGLPFMRPLVLNYPDDPQVWQMGSQYLWGDDLLVAPVTREGATEWPVYLPGGTWYDFWTQERHDGPASVSVPAPLDRMPLFVRAGAILPLGPVVQYQDGHPPAALTLLVYPAARSSFTLYEDDGSTNAYRQGHYALTEFACQSEAGSTICRVGTPRMDVSLVPPDRSYTIQMRAPKPPRSVELEGAGVLRQSDASGVPGWSHDGVHFLFIRLKAHPATIRITW
ncbi:MAG: glycoside hydrolase family 31 protein [Proteobacteria bacterium]|nr:glycoside hydrolase family 31 protein [Pseudomonadota bacterium]